MKMVTSVGVALHQCQQAFVPGNNCKNSLNFALTQSLSNSVHSPFIHDIVVLSREERLESGANVDGIQVLPWNDFLARLWPGKYV